MLARREVAEFGIWTLARRIEDERRPLPVWAGHQNLPDLDDMGRARVATDRWLPDLSTRPGR